MFTRILIGVDGREGARDALALGARLAAVSGGELTAVHVAHDARDGSPIDSSEYEALLARELAAAGVRATTLVIGGHSPGEGLRLAAERTLADVLVLGSSHRGRIGRVLAGDTGRATLHGAPCAVAVARRGAHAESGSGWAVGVGFDGSPEARRALALATEVARTTGGSLRLMAVGEPADRLLDATPSGRAWSSLEEKRRRSAEAMLAEAVDRLRLGGVEATGDAVSGFAPEKLECLSDQVDLLVVGSRGHGVALRVLLGSTADALLHHAHCPVLVVPRGAAATEPGRSGGAEAA
jgi:nucleotide-binding universal stress UspA family protein